MAAGAYGAWILFPIYFKSVASVPALEILFNRVVWSLLFSALVLTWQRRWGFLGPAVRDRRVLGLYSVAAVLLAVNWYIYIWAVNHGHILEGSLGYFINPLVSVLLGVVVLHERLRAGQWFALSIAFLGVAYLTWNYGNLPWIALSLAFTWAFYGLIKKRAPLPAAEGLTLETAVLFLPALVGLIWFAVQGTGSLFSSTPRTSVLLMLSGPITAIPLMLFAGAAQRLPLTVIGVMQYIAPTGQFLLAVLLYDEPIPTYKWIGFAVIWFALLLFWLEGVVDRRRTAERVATAAQAVGDPVSKTA
jgi:chloramphenicol-sensitive protein RarD